MSIVMEILEGLWKIQLNYKGVPTNALFVSNPWGNKKNSYYSTICRLHKNGLIERRHNNWIITKTGKKYFKENKRLLNFKCPFDNKDPKNLLLMFDIPEENRMERRWFRFHLKKFKYSMVQKSVWVGPSPLPREFVSYLKEIKLTSCIKTFKLAKPYNL